MAHVSIAYIVMTYMAVAIVSAYATATASKLVVHTFNSRFLVFLYIVQTRLGMTHELEQRILMMHMRLYFDTNIYTLVYTHACAHI